VALLAPALDRVGLLAAALEPLPEEVRLGCLCGVLSTGVFAIWSPRLLEVAVCRVAFPRVSNAPVGHWCTAPGWAAGDLLPVAASLNRTGTAVRAETFDSRAERTGNRFTNWIQGERPELGLFPRPKPWD